ncbi:MAG: 4-(cytidine 5'-diphospho)-2-C-methyl-D-erythritol kinase [Chloroflexi bacterium]|nr:4-(cytidine 5'-diphospho)-2-C-methyl-D-erythritol kinase [Chloroflexota bacterium]
MNLGLEVVGRRPDGSHDLVSLFQTIDLHDELRLEPAGELALVCTDPGLAGPDNLVWRAARLLRERAGGRDGARLELHKGIPVAAGLGGGSADAAAALLACDRLWQTSLSPGDLADLAATLGADVPFFLGGGTALVEGRGEIVSPLPPAPTRWLLLLCPPLHLERKTASLYARLTPALYDSGAATRSAAAAVGRGLFPAETLLRNTFAQVADAAFVDLAAYRERLAGAVAGRPVHLSGSGPALFVVYERREEAEGALAALRSEGLAVYLTATGPWRGQPAVEFAAEE